MDHLLLAMKSPSNLRAPTSYMRFSEKTYETCLKFNLSVSRNQNRPRRFTQFSNTEDRLAHLVHNHGRWGRWEFGSPKWRSSLGPCSCCGPSLPWFFGCKKAPKNIPKSLGQLSSVQNPAVIFEYTDWFIGMLIMANSHGHWVTAQFMEQPCFSLTPSSIQAVFLLDDGTIYSPAENHLSKFRLCL